MVIKVIYDYEGGIKHNAAVLNWEHQIYIYRIQYWIIIRVCSIFDCWFRGKILDKSSAASRLGARKNFSKYNAYKINKSVVEIPSQIISITDLVRHSVLVFSSYLLLRNGYQLCRVRFRWVAISWLISWWADIVGGVGWGGGSKVCDDSFLFSLKIYN